MFTTTHGKAHAREIGAMIRAYGVDSIPEYRAMLLDLHGMPMTTGGAKALAAAVYHLDGVEVACRALCEDLFV
jgi:hypothetical protein